MTTSDARSRTMRAVKSKNTGPELFVRRLLHGRGFRYRLHRRDLPGCPDIVLVARRQAIFVNGCFWHGHECKRGRRVPAANREYWLSKVARNKARDANSQMALIAAGWKVLVVWECELRDHALLEQKVISSIVC